MSDPTTPSRRTFLELAATGVGALATGACGHPGEVSPLRPGGDSPERPGAPAPGLDTGWEDTGVEVPDCEGTDGAGEGPYYMEGSPHRVDLASTSGESGTAFRLTMVVRSAATCELLADAEVDFWHVQQTGEYDLSSAAGNYRCTLRTGFDGTVVIDTIKPIPYVLDPVAGTWMESHFHMKVRALQHEELTTQLRFVDAEHADPLFPEANRMVPDVAADGSESATFTLVLEPA